MNYANYIRHQLTEAKTKGDLYFHGTSSTFLDSIKQGGLIPEPQRKVYGSDHGLESFPGVYLAGDPDDAMSAASNAVDKFGGEPILIGVLVDRTTAFADEDRVWDFFENYFDYDLKRFFKETPDRASVARAYQKDPAYRGKVQDKLYNDFVAMFTEVDRGTFDRLVDATMRTIMANPKQADMIGMGTVSSTVGPSYRSDMLAIINSIPGRTFSTDMGQDTIRVVKPIRFKGVPRIAWIENIETGEALYGKPKY